MWSGSLLTNYSGAITGAHQRLNRKAYKYIKSSKYHSSFPTLKEILHFEGKNGPDGIKAKSPAQDEPWHYFNPYDNNDKDVIDFISAHYSNLVKSLKNKNKQRSAFEAAWLAHAIVDGLTPAHHYPYEEELEKLRGEPKNTRSSIKKKLIIPGKTKAEMIKKNWKMWGAKGLFTTHGTFELGVAMLLMGVSTKKMKIEYDLNKFKTEGLANYYRTKAITVADKRIYEKYYKRGWTIALANDVRLFLIPTILEAVSLVWMSALIDANEEVNK